MEPHITGLWRNSGLGNNIAQDYDYTEMSIVCISAVSIVSIVFYIASH